MSNFVIVRTGTGIGGVRRHRKVLPEVLGLSAKEIRRLGRRGGFQRIAGFNYPVTSSPVNEKPSILKVFIQTVTRAITIYMEQAERKLPRAWVPFTF